MKSEPRRQRLEIRPYRAEDFEALFVLDQQCFAPHVVFPREDLRYFLEQQHALSLVCESVDGAVAGFIIAQLYPGRATFQARIVTIDVAPEFRRAGVASALMDACEAAMRTRQVQRVRLEVAVENAAARAFYERYGYQWVAALPAYYAVGEDAMAMQKTL